MSSADSTTRFDRLEKTFLAEMCASPDEVIPEARARLRRESFSDAARGTLFVALCELHATVKGGDFDRFALEKHLRAAGATAALEVFDALPDGSNHVVFFREHIEDLEGEGRRRELVTMLTAALRCAHNSDAPFRQVHADVLGKLTELNRLGLGSEDTSFEAHSLAALREIEATCAANDRGELQIAEFGVQSLDGYFDNDPRYLLWHGGLINGLFNQQLIAIAGAPAAGKTSLAWQAVRHTARGGGRVLVYSGEMLPVELRKRDAARALGIPQARLMRGILSPEERAALKKYLGESEPLEIDVFGTKQIRTVQDLRARFLAEAARTDRPPVRLVLVDHMGCLGLERDSRLSEDALVTERASVLKTLAQEINAPVMVICILNKSGQQAQGREGKAPLTTDLKGSGCDYFADTVIFLVKEALKDGETENPRARKVRVHAAKMRADAGGNQLVMFDGLSGVFTPMPDDSPDAYDVGGYGNSDRN